jgi:hypothetical protein
VIEIRFNRPVVEHWQNEVWSNYNPARSVIPVVFANPDYPTPILDAQGQTVGYLVKTEDEASLREWAEGYHLL